MVMSCDGDWLTIRKLAPNDQLRGKEYRVHVSECFSIVSPQKDAAHRMPESSSDESTEDDPVPINTQPPLGSQGTSEDNPPIAHSQGDAESNDPGEESDAPEGIDIPQPTNVPPPRRNPTRKRNPPAFFHDSIRTLASAYEEEEEEERATSGL